MARVKVIPSTGCCSREMSRSHRARLYHWDGWKCCACFAMTDRECSDLDLLKQWYLRARTWHEHHASTLTVKAPKVLSESDACIRKLLNMHFPLVFSLRVFHRHKCAESCARSPAAAATNIPTNSRSTGLPVTHSQLAQASKLTTDMALSFRLSTLGAWRCRPPHAAAHRIIIGTNDLQQSMANPNFFPNETATVPRALGTQERR